MTSPLLIAPFDVSPDFEANGHVELDFVLLASDSVSLVPSTAPHGFQKRRTMGCKYRCQMNKKKGITIQGTHTILLQQLHTM